MLNREEVTQSTVQGSERRREPRIERPAPVKVCLEHADGKAEFQAVLVNTSTTGLAIRHWRKELSVGQQICVTGDLLGEIVARVMWNWTVGPLVISGLQKLEKSSIALVEHCRAGATNAASGKSRSWLWAALTGLLIVVTWYVSRS